jgi:squalene synthase HpnC
MRENFPVALRVLPAVLRAQLEATYRFARHVDDLGDEAPGDRVAQLQAVAEDVRTLYAGGSPRDAAVAGMRVVTESTAVSQECLLRLVEANLRDQETVHYQTFEELLDYCRLSANPVGEIVLHVFGCATPERVALSDRVCTALQLLEHWKDVGEDYRAGRVYLPKVDLQRFRVGESDLGAPSAGPALRALVAFETERAAAWLGAGAPLVSTLHGWARLAVSGYVAGGRAAAARLRRAGYDPLGGDVHPRATGVARAWAEATVRWAG